MPRAKPTQVIENRHTFGTFERRWVVEQENWVKTRLNIASAGVVAVPVGMVIGLGALGYGAYAGMCAIAGAIPKNPFKPAGETFDWITDTINNEGDKNLKQDGGSYLGFILRGFKSVDEYNSEGGGGGGDF